MDTITKRFCRSLTATERKQFKELGELCGIDYNCPLLSYKNTINNYKNEIRFFEIWKNSLFETPITQYITILNGIVISLDTAGGERLYYFELDEYPVALDFYNKMIEAIKNNNNF